MPQKYLTLEQWGKIMAKAWLDPAFKDEFERDPRQAIEQLLPDIEFDRFFRLPYLPREILTEEQINGILGGTEKTIPYLTI